MRQCTCCNDVSDGARAAPQRRFRVQVIGFVRFIAIGSVAPHGNPRPHADRAANRHFAAQPANTYVFSDASALWASRTKVDP
jgi:hypothetical protein